MVGLLDWLGITSPQYGPPAPNTGILTNPQGIREQALYGALGQLGAGLLAAGQRRPVSQPSMLPQALAGFGPSYRQGIQTGQQEAAIERQADQERRWNDLSSGAASLPGMTDAQRQILPFLGPQQGSAALAQWFGQRSGGPVAPDEARTILGPNYDPRVSYQRTANGTIEPISTPSQQQANAIATTQVTGIQRPGQGGAIEFPYGMAGGAGVGPTLAGGGGGAGARPAAGSPPPGAPPASAGSLYRPGAPPGDPRAGERPWVAEDWAGLPGMTREDAQARADDMNRIQGGITAPAPGAAPAGAMAPRPGARPMAPPPMNPIGQVSGQVGTPTMTPEAQAYFARGAPPAGSGAPPAAPPRNPIGAVPNPTGQTQGYPGVSIRPGPSGRPWVTIAAPPEAAAPATITELQRAAVDDTQRLGRLQEIAGRFNPEWLTYSGRMTNWGRGILERAGMDIGQEGRRQLAEYESFRSTVANEFNQTLHAMSGAAVTPNELERMQMSAPSLEDSPTQFQSKLQTTIENVALANARRHYMLSQGLRPSFTNNDSVIPLSQMRGIIDARGNELFQSFRSQNMTEGEARARVQAQLRQEFGMGSM